MQFSPALASGPDTAERRLFGAIILQAVQDAFFLCFPAKDMDQHDAFVFLTAKTGALARGRHFYCDALGLHETRLTAWVIDVLEGRKDPPSFTAAEIDLSPDQRLKLAQARKRWAMINAKPAHKSNPKPETFSANLSKGERMVAANAHRRAALPEIPIVDGVWLSTQPPIKARLGDTEISREGSRQRALLNKVLRGLTHDEFEANPKSEFDLVIIRKKFDAATIWRGDKMYLAPRPSKLAA